MAAPAAKSNPSMNVIGLLRVSTDLQDVARQRTDLERLKQRFGINILRKLELVGLSGTATLDDEQVQQVLADLKKPGVGGIGVSSLDRLFRPGKRFGQFAILDHFMDENKVIYSAREGLIDPNTDEGYDKCIQAGGRAGAEWRLLRQRSKDGKAEKVGQGRMVNPAAVYGYKYVPKHVKDERTCAQHPKRLEDPQKCGQFLEFGDDEAKLDVVRRVYAERAMSMPPYRIAKGLNQDGIRSAKGGLWSRQTILQMLAHTAYNGRFLYNGEELPCPKLIDDELWNKVQEIRAISKVQWTGRPSEIYLLRGYIWCSRCGHRCVAYRSGNRKWGFYRCGNRTEHPPRKYLCDVPPVRQEIAEQTAWSAVWGLLINAELLLQLGQAYYDAMGRPEADGIEKLEQEAARLMEDEETIIEMVKRRMITINQGEIDLKKIRDRIAQIKIELKVAGRVVALPPKDAVEATLRGITDGPEPKTYEGRRDILEGIRDLRMNYLNGDLEITGKVPVYDPAESTGSDRKKCSRSIGAYAQGKRQDGDGGEDWTLAEDAASVADVLCEGFEGGKRPEVTHALFPKSAVAEAFPGFGRVATLCQVEREFIFQIALELSPPQ